MQWNVLPNLQSDWIWYR